MREFVRNVMMGLGLAGAALSLAACGSKEAAQEKATGPKSIEDVQKEAGKLQRPEPGQYKQTVEITNFEVPGMSKEAAERMRAMMTARRDTLICLTKEDSEKGFKDMFNNIGKGSQCSYSHFDVDGGKIDAQMDCASPQGGTATMNLAGAVTPGGSDVVVDMNVKGGKQPMGDMQMTMHMTTERVGDCKP